MPDSKIAVSPSLQAFRESLRILVVDDEESLRGILSETIGETGLKVDTAESGELAIDKFKDVAYHLVMTDIRMAGISGIELLQRIKASYPTTEVIIMTSHASMDSAVSAIRAGAYDYLMKPFNNLEEIVALVNRAVDKIFLRYENERLLRELADKNQRLTEMNREIKTLYNFSNFLTQSLDMNEVKEKSMSCFRDLSGGMNTVFLAYYQGQLVMAEALPSEYLGERRGQALVSLEKMRMEDILVWFRRANEDSVFQKTVSLYFQTNSFYAAPIVFGNQPHGILVCLGEDGLPFPQRVSRLLQQFSQIVTVAFDNASLHKQMKDYAVKDGLTGLFNHRYFQERLASEVVRAHRYSHPVSLIFVDVDHFKKFNDTNGHPMGDAVLRGVSSIISTKSRKSDVVARYGGEEFVVILPETDKAGAMIMAEELRKAVESHTFPGGENQPLGRVTSSLGVATYPHDAQEAKTLIKSADLALYHSKHAGRNRVTPYTPDLASSEAESKEAQAAH